jgi:hypothetical protein
MVALGDESADEGLGAIGFGGGLGGEDHGIPCCGPICAIIAWAYGFCIACCWFTPIGAPPTGFGGPLGVGAAVGPMYGAAYPGADGGAGGGADVGIAPPSH